MKFCRGEEASFKDIEFVGLSNGVFVHRRQPWHTLGGELVEQRSGEVWVAALTIGLQFGPDENAPSEFKVVAEGEDAKKLNEASPIME